MLQSPADCNLAFPPILTAKRPRSCSVDDGDGSPALSAAPSWKRKRVTLGPSEQIAPGRFFLCLISAYCWSWCFHPALHSLTVGHGFFAAAYQHSRALPRNEGTAQIVSQGSSGIGGSGVKTQKFMTLIVEQGRLDTGKTKKSTTENTIGGQATSSEADTETATRRNSEVAASREAENESASAFEEVQPTSASARQRPAGHPNYSRESLAKKRAQDYESEKGKAVAQLAAHASNDKRNKAAAAPSSGGMNREENMQEVATPARAVENKAFKKMKSEGTEVITNVVPSHTIQVQQDEVPEEETVDQEEETKSQSNAGPSTVIGPTQMIRRTTREGEPVAEAATETIFGSGEHKSTPGGASRQIVGETSQERIAMLKELKTQEQAKLLRSKQPEAGLQPSTEANARVREATNKHGTMEADVGQKHRQPAQLIKSPSDVAAELLRKRVASEKEKQKKLAATAKRMTVNVMEAAAKRMDFAVSSSTSGTAMSFGVTANPNGNKLKFNVVQSGNLQDAKAKEMAGSAAPVPLQDGAGEPQATGTTSGAALSHSKRTKSGGQGQDKATAGTTTSLSSGMFSKKITRTGLHAAVTSLSVDDVCERKENKNLNGHNAADLASGLVPGHLTFEECRDWCRRSSDCTGFVHDGGAASTADNCVIKTSHDDLDVVDQQGQTYVQMTDECRSALHQDIDDVCEKQLRKTLNGKDLIAGGTGGRVKGRLTYDECLDWCAKNSDCTGFVHVRQEQNYKEDNCAAKGQHNETDVSDDDGTDYTVMTDDCRAAKAPLQYYPPIDINDACGKDVDHDHPGNALDGNPGAGGPDDRVPGHKTYDECLAWCAAEGTCEGFSFVNGLADTEDNCVVKAVHDYGTRVALAQTDYTRMTRACRFAKFPQSYYPANNINGLCAREGNKQLTGNTLEDVAESKTFEECRELCARSMACTGFVFQKYNSTGITCELKSEHPASGDSAWESVTTADYVQMTRPCRAAVIPYVRTKTRNCTAGDAVTFKTKYVEANGTELEGLQNRAPFSFADVQWICDQVTVGVNRTRGVLVYKKGVGLGASGFPSPYNIDASDQVTHNFLACKEELSDVEVRHCTVGYFCSACVKATSRCTRGKRQNAGVSVYNATQVIDFKTQEAEDERRPKLPLLQVIDVVNCEVATR
ncbi:unnamed protein product [Amoebophrya sp. A120]|nr:unnamed protein product [Amoebophrya sp. A120]|eukprot:GSA120T00022628001.1